MYEHQKSYGDIENLLLKLNLYGVYTIPKRFHNVHFIKLEPTRTDQELIRTYQESNRNRPELHDSGWFLVGSCWVLIDSWWVPEKDVWLILTLFAAFYKRETTRTHQELIRIHQKPSRNAWFWLIPGGFLLDSYWIPIGSLRVLVVSR